MAANRILTRSFIALIALAALLEVGLRVAGVVDFPIYDVDDGIGYLIRPNQSGAFLRTHTWVFNDRSMGTAAAWNPSPKPDVLLIGNSIVMGGNHYSQPQKIGPEVQALLGDRVAVWPIAVGGWTEVNETVYLERNPDVASHANFFVWVVLRGGLGELSQWRGDYVFPHERPLSATWYVLRRYVLPHFIDFEMSELPPQSSQNQANVDRFETMVGALSHAANRPIPGILVLYPTEADLRTAAAGADWLPERSELERIAAKYGVRILDLSKRPEWHIGLYRGGTHPTVTANPILSKIIADEVRSVYEP